MPAKIAVPPEAQSRIVAAYRAGQSAAAAGAPEGLNAQKALAVLRENGVSIRSWSEASAARSANAACTNEKRGRKGAFHSRTMNRWLPTASCYEYARMMQHDEDLTVASFSRCADRIPYTLDGRTRHYTPDLEVTLVTGEVIVEEIKPAAFMRDLEVRAKAAAAEVFYAAHGKRYVVVTEEQIGAELITAVAASTASLSGSQAAALRSDRRRESSRQYARRMRASRRPTAQERQAHAARENLRYLLWRQSATPSELDARRSRVREAQRRHRLKKTIGVRVS